MRRALAIVFALLLAASSAQADVSVGNGNVAQFCNSPVWTIADQSGAALTITTNVETYCKTGQSVTFAASITYPVTANGSSARVNAPTANNVGGNNICTANAGALNLQVNVTGGLLVFWTTTGTTQQLNSALTGVTIYMNCTYLTTS